MIGNKLFKILTLAFLIGTPFVSHGALTDNLVSWWEMNETSGVRYDAHGANDLTDNNTVTYDTGIKGNSASFTPASNESLTRAVGTSDDLNITGDMTIAFWMKHHDASPSGSNDDIVNRYGSSGLTAYRILLADNGIYFFHHDGTTLRAPLFTSADPVQNTWTHCVFILDVSASTVQLYFNGTSLGTGAIGTVTRSSDKPLTIGKYPDGTGNNLNGDIDELGIWSRTLSSTEVSTLYNSGNGIAYPSAGGATTYTTGISGIDFY